jgi:predicted AlkP superfamily phosphohydrolase/phosphomutase
MRRVIYPSGLYDTLKGLPWFNVKELAMDVNMDEKAVEGCPEEEYEDWIKLHTRREQQWFEVLRYLMREDPCHLMAVVFDGVDKLQHLCWRFLDPALFPKTPSPWERKIRVLCLDYFRQLDQFIAQIVALAGSEANVFVASDHGFGATKEIFYLNAWLNQRGYLEWADGARAHGRVSSKLGLDVPRKQAYLLDWTKTTAYALTPSSNGIHICVAGQRGKEGILPKDYEGFRRKLMEDLLRFTDPATGEAVISHIWTREDAFAGSQMRDAPDLTVTLRDNGFISILNSDVLLESRTEPLGTHYPEGIFIAGGPGIGKGISPLKLSILDVAPALLYSLGLPSPDDFEGCVPEEIFEPSSLRARPVRIGEPTQAPEPFPQRRAADEVDDQAKTLAMLKALGYME